MVYIAQAAEVNHHLSGEFRQINRMTQSAMHEPTPQLNSTPFQTWEASLIRVCNSQGDFVPRSMKIHFGAIWLQTCYPR